MDTLTHLFTSRVRIKLLTFFLSRPQARAYIRQLARETGENVRNVIRELQNLQAMGLLSSERVGNLKYYTPNPRFPLYEELRGIVAKSVGVVGRVQGFVQQLAGVQRAFLYGSYVKGTDAVTSDIDLVLVGQADLREVNRRLGPIEAELRREINYLIYQPLEFERKRRKDPFLKDVLAGPVLWLKGGPK